jgi:pimeloyl-ACP methyl ester carboxylesterase
MVMADTNLSPFSYKTYHLELPLSRLHILEAGSGEPLIVVPATISELENWVDLIQFMAQWFHVYFFELPGHGGSSAFSQRFSTSLVAETVAHLADRLQLGRFNLMGFSFGGILAMRTFQLLHDRIDRVILNAPCVTRRAILLSKPQKFAMWNVNLLFRRQMVRRYLHRSFHHPRRRARLVTLFQTVGKVEHREHLENKLARTSLSTIEVLTEEIAEIMNVEFPHPAQKFDTPCYLTMSVNDPLLDFQTTLDELECHFENVYVTRLDFPFHQPPKPFTFDELNRDFKESANKFLR